MERILFFEPDEKPILGLRSNVSASRNFPGSGYFTQIQNQRWADTGEFTTRLGIPAALSSAVGASGIWRGAMSCVFSNGFGTTFATTKDSSNITHVWKSTDCATWTEITASSGKYGDTRIVADGSNNDYETSFALVHDAPSGKDCVVIQNGYDSPRVYDGTALVKHEEVPLPSNLDSMRTFFQWKETTSYGNPAHFTVGGGGAGTVVATDGGAASPDDFVTLTINGAATGANAFVTQATPVHHEDAAQIHIAVEGTSDAIQKFVQGIKIQARDTAGTPATKSLYEPADATVAGSDAYPQPTQTAINGVPGWVILTYQVPTDWVTASVDRYTFTWAIAVSSGASVSLNILSIFASNHTTSSIKGDCEHAIAYYNSGSRAESAEVVLDVHQQFLQALGVKTVTSATFGTVSTLGATIPHSPLLRYTATVYYRNTTAAQRDKGVDTARLYRSDFGEENFYYCKDISLATWGGASWAFASGSALSLEHTDDGVQNGDRNYQLRSPGDFQEPIPIGRAMVAANDRLIVGAKATDLAGNLADAFPRIMESRVRGPFRFSEVSDETDPDTAGFHTLPGENIQAFAAAPGVGTSSSAVVIFTDASVWNANTHAVGSSFALTRAATVGTNCPNSIIERHGEIYFVDTQNRVRRLSDGAWLSEAVDDKFQGIPTAYRRKIFGCYFQDRLYFCYTPAGQTVNNRILIYSLKANAWESDDKLPSLQADLLIKWTGANSGVYGASQDPRLIFFNSGDRKAYRYESGTQDLGSDIAVVITHGDLHRDWNAWTLAYWAILCTGASQTLTYTATYKPKNPSGVTGGTIPLSAANTYDWAKSVQLKSGATDSAAGVTFSGSITGNLTGGHKILGLALYVDNNNSDPRGN
jgi:hypothetical protein